MVRKAYKYRIGPTKGQQRILHEMLEEARWVYNQTLALRKDGLDPLLWTQDYAALRCSNQRCSCSTGVK